MKNSIGYKLVSVLVPFFGLFLSGSALADVEGIWRGTLEPAPGTEMLVEFTVEAVGDNQYTVVLNTPESAAIENVAASQVSYDDETLSLEVAELSGSFQGKLVGEELVGTWSQPGAELPLTLALYEAPEFSAEQIATIQGKWIGTISRGETPIQEVVWRFEIDDAGKLTGFMGPAARNVAFIPIQNILIGDEAFSFTVNDANGNYSGVIANGEITGNWSQQGQQMTLNMVPRAEEEPTEALVFSEELVASVVGGWSGTIVIDDNQSQDIVWRFESNDDGGIEGLMGPAAQGPATIPMDNIVITETELSFDVYAAGGEFKGSFSAEGLSGTWTQGLEMSMTMSRD